MNIIDRVRADLTGAKRGRIEQVADEIGLARGTFRKIVAGSTRFPRYDTVLAIESYYRRRHGKAISPRSLR